MKIDFIELTSTILALTAVWLNTKQITLTWPFSVIAKTLAIFVYYQSMLYVKCIQEGLLVINSVYGWYSWTYGGKNKTRLMVTQIPKNKLLALILLCLVLTLGLGKIFMHYTLAAMPYQDSLHSICALLAHGLLARKKIQGWLIWLVADILFIRVCLIQEKYFFSIKYIIYSFLAIYGYYAWHKTITYEPKSSKDLENHFNCADDRSE